MKKLLIVVAALAMVVSFLPKAEAGETAALGLSVTFLPDEPLKIWSIPEGPFTVERGKNLTFEVIAEDYDTQKISLSAASLPEGATFDVLMVDVDAEGYYPTNQVSGIFSWTPGAESNTTTTYVPTPIYFVTFIAKNAEGEEVRLGVEITVFWPQTISVEVRPLTWSLEGVKLGERISNTGLDGSPIHGIANTGTVPVIVDIGYGPRAEMYPLIIPGLEQGLDTFITIVGDTVLPPNERIKLMHSIGPNEIVALPLTYGAPTALSFDAPGMGATYEIRAYMDVPIYAY